jgi:heme/copper-type cytochrome/quinol oxidase subunit 2
MAVPLDRLDTANAPASTQGLVTAMRHTQEPSKDTEVRDQQKFDEAVNSKGKVVLEWLAGAGVVAALAMSMVALIQSGKGSEATLAAQPAVKQAQAPSAEQAQGAATAKAVDLKIVGASKLGPDGKKHDVFTKTDFAVKVGQPLKLRINNTDDVPHSITAPVADVNITIQPGTHTYKLVVKQAGRFQWFCIIPCDSDSHGWAMQNAGFMSGYITAT